MANKQINRIKVVLVDKQKTNKWLAEQLGKDKTTISKWCTNTSQPDLESLMKIAKLLDVDIAAHPIKSVARLTKYQRYAVEKERNVPYTTQLTSECLQFGIKGCSIN